MSNHVTEWLNAYLDGELQGKRLLDVETHIAGCENCQKELEFLEKLSDLLQEIPAPDYSPVERFAAQVNLRLPSARPVTSRSKTLEVGWWMIPVGLLAVLIFINTSFLVSDMLLVASSFGMLADVSNWMRFGEADWSTTLGQFGVLSGNSLDLAASTETFTRALLPQIVLQSLIALLYLSWIAIWWARRRREEPGQLLES